MKMPLRSLAIAGVLCAAAISSYAATESHGTADSRPRGHSKGITCSVAAVSLAFGSYNPFRVGHNDTAGNIAVTCSGRPGAVVAYSIALDAGESRTFAQRRMRSGSRSALHYNIYTRAGRTIVWGDGHGGSHVVTDSFALHGAKVTKNYPVYGRIFSGQNARVGAYSDSIVVTLDF